MRSDVASRDETHRAVEELVAGAAAGDSVAWESLVDRFAPLVWAIARAHRLNDSDAGDVSQTTWLRLLEHVDRLHEPAFVGSWLATTARRESLRVIAYNRRTVPVCDAFDALIPDPAVPEPDSALIAEEDGAAARRALDVLPARWRAVVDLLISDPPLSYEEIADRLDMPVGSIGPTRGRCLGRLRAALDT